MAKTKKLHFWLPKTKKDKNNNLYFFLNMRRGVITFNDAREAVKNPDFILATHYRSQFFKHIEEGEIGYCGDTRYFLDDTN